RSSSPRTSPSLSSPAPPTTAIYTLSLHDALPISPETIRQVYKLDRPVADFEATLAALCETDMEVVPHIVIGLHYGRILGEAGHLDRKSTRLNSSHVKISYAVFCLKKKKETTRVQLLAMSRKLLLMSLLLQLVQFHQDNMLKVRDGLIFVYWQPVCLFSLAIRIVLR